MADYSKPRVLCLHGGGVSARIFELQMRYFIRSLKPHFRLVFADGPWLSEMHDDLKPVYSEMGPCRRWAGWKPHHPPLDHAVAVEQIERALTSAMNQDDGDGEWVGLIGFSQGAKLAFSILLENQLRLQKNPRAQGFAGVHWQFGVIMAARPTPFNLARHASDRNTTYSSVSQNSSKGVDEQAWSGNFPDKLRTPTLHVHGLQDGGLEQHRKLLKHFTSPAHSRLVEWEGAHRIPVKTADVKMVTEAILDVAEAADVTWSMEQLTKDRYRTNTQDSYRYSAGWSNQLRLQSMQG